MTTPRDETTVTAGRLRGQLGESNGRAALHFGAVPYAAAPVGEGRFASPRPVEPWVGVRDATGVSAAPPQVVAADGRVPDMAPAAISEDCLTAEVWTPAVEGRRPVLVWIPGGAYRSGGAGLATYDGARLAAEHDLVVVGLNYRLGVLGFLHADGVPANVGLRDLLAALRWLRDEVSAFGGDPERIVIMGESAGAGAICHLLAIPETADLIAGAIVQSGAPGATLDPATAARVGETVLAAAGVRTVDELRAVPVNALLAAQEAAVAQLLTTVGMMPLHPVVDGDLLPMAPLDAARAGSIAPVPLVIGTTADEMELFRDDVPPLPEDIAVAFLSRKLAPVLGHTPTADEIRRGLAAVDGDLVEAVADADLHLPAIAIADAHAASGWPTWRYRFDWKAPQIGAAHALDLPFTFGTLDVADWRDFAGAHDPRSDRLSAAMRLAWAAFAHDLVPACAPIGAWPRYDPVRRATVHLTDPVHVTDDPDGDRRRAWTGGADEV